MSQIGLRINKQKYKNLYEKRYCCGDIIGQRLLCNFLETFMTRSKSRICFVQHYFKLSGELQARGECVGGKEGKKRWPCLLEHP